MRLAKLRLSRFFLPLIAVPTATYLLYSFIRGELNWVQIIFSVFALIMGLFFYYYMREKPPTKIDEKLVTFLLHMYAVSHGQVDAEDLVNVVADNPDYGYYSKVFRKIRSLAKDLGYGFTKATAKIAETVKTPLKDILVRCVEVFSTTQPKGYLELEETTMAEEYSGYYQRSIESIRTIGGIFSTIQSVIVFIVMTLDILTIFMADPNVVYYAYGVSAVAILAIYAGLRAVVPGDALIHMDRKNQPALYRNFKLSLPIAAACIAPTIIIARMLGVPFAMLFYGAILVFPGLLANKFEYFVYKIDEHYPTFIKALGENMASTSDMKAALSYVLYMELGPLKALLKKALARARLGLSNEKALAMLSAEAGSHRVHSMNKIFVDAVNFGGDPLQIGTLIGNRCVRLLEFRKRRLSVEKSFEAVVFLLQPLSVALLIILTFLCRYFSQSLMSLPYFTFGEIPISVVEIGNIIIIVLITITNALGLNVAKGGFWGTTLLYAGILLMLSGVAWLGAELFMNIAFGTTLQGFEQLI
ncbi:MAG: hypothetical protein RMJ07_01650 [Nitrososphaerota archaeon]|nr:hypothetical protein [Candidatus Bathyarchaeota archaeon]MDW8048374.1 hypothetical protein [Nitrososphaerota archaeon]